MTTYLVKTGSLAPIICTRRNRRERVEAMRTPRRLLASGDHGMGVFLPPRAALMVWCTSARRSCGHRDCCRHRRHEHQHTQTTHLLSHKQLVNKAHAHDGDALLLAQHGSTHRQNSQSHWPPAWWREQMLVEVSKQGEPRFKTHCRKVKYYYNYNTELC